MSIDTKFAQKNMSGVAVPFDPNLDFLIGIQHERGNDDDLMLNLLAFTTKYIIRF